MANIGDINGDGVPDVLVGAPDETVGGTLEAGRAYTYSGADGSRLTTFTSPNVQTEGYFGSAVSGIGDVDGDGTADLLVGAYNEGTSPAEAGRVYLFSGATGNLIRTFTSPDPETCGNADDGGHFGFAVTGTQDFNSDGTPDLLVGAPEETAGGTACDDAGQAYLLSGADGSTIQTLTSPNASSVVEYANFGDAVAQTGDTDGDGTPDLLVGAPRSGGTDFGRVYLFSGADGSPLHTMNTPNQDADGRFGDAVAGVKDVSGDGTPDLLIGAPNEDDGGATDAGYAYLYSGADGSRLRTLDSPNAIEGTGSFGDAVAGAGDFNGDGTPDVLVGASSEVGNGNEGAGRAYLISGADGSVIRPFDSPDAQIDGRFGVEVTLIGDTNGDGTPDVFAGASEETIRIPTTENAGQAHLLSGANGSTLHTLESPNAQEPGAFGERVAGIGDVNGDGARDVLVGAPSETPGNSAQAGRAYLFSGSDGRLLRTLTSPNMEAEGRFGSDVAGIGDVSGDGVPDFAVGADGESTERVYLFSGATGTVLRTLTSPNSGANFGASIAGVGDTNGDGTPDVFVSASFEDGGGTELAGRAYLFSGADGSVLRTLTSPNPESRGVFGTAVAGTGDTNGDGTPDLIVGAVGETAGGISDAGRAYLFSGAGGTTPLQTFSSPNAEEDGIFGTSVAGVADTDGDGAGEVFVGARSETVNGDSGAGRAYLFSGSNGTRLQTLTSPNSEVSGQFGRSVSGVADASGDGVPDLLVGASLEDDGVFGGAGRAYLLSGADGSRLRTLVPSLPAETGRFGRDLTSAGDIDGNGTPDLLIGAPGETANLTGDETEGAGRTYVYKLTSTGAFTVNVTTDAPDVNPGNGVCATQNGNCSLRAALQEANDGSGAPADSIHFDIVGSSPYTIQPQTPLPDVTDPVVIDGRTEPSFSGTPVVAIDGSAISGSTTLSLESGSGGSAVLSLSLINSTNSIALFARTDNNLIDGCWIEVAPDGTVAGGASWGIRVFGSSNQIGLPSGRGNVVVGTSTGIDVSNSSSPGNLVQNNRIGETPSGTVAGNQFGVTTGGGGGGNDNLIGGSGGGNVIAHNTVGVAIRNGTGNTIRSNRVFDNADLGIDLANDGRTANDTTPADQMDDDDGANRLQNFPLIQSSEYDEGTDKVTLTYEVPSQPGLSGSGAAVYPLTVDFYKAGADETEGKRLIHTDTYTSSDFTAGPGKTITFTPPSDVSLARTDHVVGTATDARGNTSEFTGESRQLPVELASVDAKVTGSESIQLTWQTASESNNAGFEVQRRTAEKNSWKQIGFVESNAEDGTTSDVQSYKFSDDSVPFEADSLTYRLRQVDFDGSASLSDEVTVHRTVEEVRLLGTFPNPVRSQATVRYAVSGPQQVSIRLYDVLGRQVKTVVAQTKEGRQELQMSVSDLASGVYLLRLKAEETVKTRRLTVVR